MQTMDKTAKNLIESLKKDKKLIFIIALGIFGMILLLLSGTTEGKKEEVKDSYDLSSAEAERRRFLI